LRASLFSRTAIAQGGIPEYMNKRHGRDGSEPEKKFRAGPMQVGQTDYVFLQGVDSHRRVSQTTNEMTGRSNNKLFLSGQEEN